MASVTFKRRRRLIRSALTLVAAEKFSEAAAKADIPARVALEMRATTAAALKAAEFAQRDAASSAADARRCLATVNEQAPKVEQLGTEARLSQQNARIAAEESRKARTEAVGARVEARTSRDRAEAAERRAAAAEKAAKETPGIKGDRGPVGPTPRHEWNKDDEPEQGDKARTRLRFALRMAQDGVTVVEWGLWSAVLRAQAVPVPLSPLVPFGGVPSAPFRRLERRRITAADSPYTVDHAVGTVLADAAAGSITVIIPAGRTDAVRIKKTDSSSNPVTIQAASGTVEGLASLPLGSQFAASDFEPDGPASNDWVMTS